MTLKNAILSLAAAAILLPAAALADGINYDVDGRYDGGGISIGVHVHTQACRHEAPPPPRPAPPPQQPQGRYELQTVRREIPSTVERHWVPESCETEVKVKHKKGKGHGHGNKKTKYVTTCEGGYYAERIIPGGYVSEQQWVWVPAPNPPHRHVSYHVAARR